MSGNGSLINEKPLVRTRYFRCRNFLCHVILLKVGAFQKDKPWFIEMLATKNVYRGKDTELKGIVDNYMNKDNPVKYVAKYEFLHISTMGQNFIVDCRCNVCGRENKIRVPIKKESFGNKVKQLMKIGTRIN